VALTRQRNPFPQRAKAVADDLLLDTQAIRLIRRATKSVENARFVCLSIAANLPAKAFWHCSRQQDDAGSDWLR